MTYNVHQHWDPLKVCAVGQSYPPEFYNFIKNQKAQSVMKRIAEETEEDYQKLLKLLHTFNIKTVRPTVPADYQEVLFSGKISPPPMTPRDYMAMIGNKFFCPSIKNNLHTHLKPIIDLVAEQGNPIIYREWTDINTAMIIRCGKDLYHGTSSYKQDRKVLLKERQDLFPEYRNRVVNSGGHADATLCPVKPGLIVSLFDIPSYKETFPDWEVVYLPGQSWFKIPSFLDLKKKNKGKWWVPGEELNDEFTDFVESWLGHWVGYVEETVFDVNMLVVDEKNVICNNENDQVFEAFARHGITPHICNFRHRYFWDGGLHCITQDLHREGTQQDYFPQRNN